MTRAKHPRCACNPATRDICGACFARRHPKREPREDTDANGDGVIDGTDYEPHGSWAE